MKNLGEEVMRVMTDAEKERLVDDLMETARELKLLADKEIAAEDEKRVNPSKD